MNTVAQNIKDFRLEIHPYGAELVAVSKFHTPEVIMEAYDAGQRIFGENRAQELVEKAPQLPSDIRWHFIGHMQTNKVRAVLPHAAMIESVDSTKLLQLIDKEGVRAGLKPRVLMQVHVAAEQTKSGFLPEELVEFFRSRQFESLQATHICGIMGMATNTDDRDRVRADFKAIHNLFDTIRSLCPDLRGFDTISMGMSGDYMIALEEGATLVRIGTAIFGPRQY